MTSPSPSRAAMVCIALTVFLDAVGIGIIVPVMPSLIREVTGGDLASAARWGGWLMFLYAILQFWAAPVLGNLSDRFGRRPVLLVSLFAFALDYLILAVAPTLLWLFVGRGLAGIAGATGSTANAYMADISSGSDRARSFGYIGGAWSLGFTLGPMIGGLLGEYGPRIPFYGAAAMVFLNFLFGVFVLRESLPRERRRAFSLRRASPIGTLAQMRRFPLVIALLPVLVLYMLAHDANPATWSYYTIEKFDWSEADIGWSISAVGILFAVVQFGVVQRGIRAFGERGAAYLGFVLMSCGYAGFAFSTQGWMMYAFILPFAFGGIAMPALRSLMSNQVPDDQQGELAGAITSVFSLTAIFSPLVMTQLFAYFSGPDAPVYFPGASFLAAALLTLLAAALFAAATATRRVDAADPV